MLLNRVLGALTILGILILLLLWNPLIKQFHRSLFSFYMPFEVQLVLRRKCSVFRCKFTSPSLFLPF